MQLKGTKVFLAFDYDVIVEMDPLTRVLLGRLNSFLFVQICGIGLVIYDVIISKNMFIVETLCFVT